MKIKLLISILGLITVGSLVFAGASYSKTRKLNSEISSLTKKETDNKGIIVKLNQTIETLSSETEVARKEIEVNPGTTYESILNEYTKKIEEAAPKLVEEYNSEYPNVKNGLEGLAELSNKKIEKLAIISNEGIFKMAELMHEVSGNYADYEIWAEKLMDVYTKEAQKIIDVYLASGNIQTATSNPVQEVNTPEPAPEVSTPPSQQEVKPEYYTVQAGDNFYRIAVNNGLTTEQLKEMNGLTSNETEVGQLLRIK